MADVHADPPGSLECVPEPADPRSSRDKRMELAIAEAASSDEASQVDGDTPNGKTRVGKGSESIGDLTVDAVQRVASAVGSVAKAPAVMANVEGLGSTASSPTSSGGTPLAERVTHLEVQMTMLEEKYNSTALVTELSNLSPSSLPTTPRSTEKLRTARSLLQETETKGTLIERVQVLENRMTEHMESIEKALSRIQSKLAHIDPVKLKPESMAVQNAAGLQESSASGEEFQDADQGSDNLEALETSSGEVGSDKPGEARGTSPTSQEALAKEPSAAASSAQPSEHAENAAEKSGIAVPAAKDSPLTSMVEKPRESLMKEPSAAAPTAEPAEPVQGDDAGKSATVLPSSEPISAFPTLEKPQGAPAKQPSMAETSVKLEEPPQVDAEDRTAAAPPLASTAEPKDGTVGPVTEDNHVQKEAEYKSAEDVKVPAEKPEAFASHIVEPKPVEHGENKEEEEKRHDVVAEGERTNSLRTEEKQKHRFKQLRNKIRHAFKFNKGS